ncbi:unnamed protein product [Penicillium nalgiovense]|uniref:Uncharacterized protein n=1 Tax=Penicillium nalgiovense TaxID=60175 RepID=A0A9W4I0U0_PENNA|nr:unnamed protein product [Penicillium nalgiovense]CAG8121805.1 unnamed protein product [Penicillium nalgiovense]CAG8183169.1 unnamed protein product [Penicillium nalgiovense]CAG8188826.1 unnamed protein product [Penicillium nalgiovense]CAG8189392.1 unnamed protein product [Penicillium nalgiovense]
MASQLMNDGLHALLRRAAEDSDPDDAPEAGSKEITSSWALFIMIMLLMFALFTSYMLQQKKIQAVHETVLSIFAGRRISSSGADTIWKYTKLCFGLRELVRTC